MFLFLSDRTIDAADVLCVFSRAWRDEDTALPGEPSVEIENSGRAGKGNHDLPIHRKARLTLD
jgi:hypothetical protein